MLNAGVSANIKLMSLTLGGIMVEYTVVTLLDHPGAVQI